MNPSSSSSGSGDDGGQAAGGQITNQNNKSQRRMTEESPSDKSPSWLIDIWKEGEDALQRHQSQGQDIRDGKTYRKIPKIVNDLESKYTKEERIKTSDKDKNKDKNEDCYQPLVVAIGPYQDRLDPEGKLKTGASLGKLETGESLKAPMTYRFIKESGKPIEDFYKDLEKVIQEAKGFYDDDSIKGMENEFTRMMFIDGCFVLQFIHYVTSDMKELKDGDKLCDELKNLSDEQIADVKRDLLLLENQLPFPVLKSLMKLRYGSEDKGMEKIDKFLPIRDRRQQFSAVSIFYWILVALFNLLFWLSCCCCCFWGRSSKNKETAREDPDPGNPPAVGDDPQTYDHLLEYLYLRFTDSPDVKRGNHYFAKLQSFITAATERSLARRGHHLYYSAKDLKKVGLHFRPNMSGALTDVKVKSSWISGTLELPPITVDKSTQSMLFNLLAYESASHPKSNLVTSYIQFLDSLIDDAEDVKELRSKGILFNYLGPDQKVAELFNNMTTSLIPVTVSYFNDVKRDINKTCESSITTWIAEWQHDYFSNPWAFIAFVAAAFTIFLTAVATYIAVWPIH